MASMDMNVPHRASFALSESRSAAYDTTLRGRDRISFSAPALSICHISCPRGSLSRRPIFGARCGPPPCSLMQASLTMARLLGTYPRPPCHGPFREVGSLAVVSPTEMGDSPPRRRLDQVHKEQNRYLCAGKRTCLHIYCCVSKQRRSRNARRAASSEAVFRCGARVRCCLPRPSLP